VGWNEALQVREVVSFTKGRIFVCGKLVSRGQAKRADCIIANPPISIASRDSERLRDDKRCQHGPSTTGNANFARVQHIVRHLAPAGAAGFVLANGSMSSNQSGEGKAAPCSEMESSAA